MQARENRHIAPEAMSITDSYRQVGEVKNIPAVRLVKAGCSFYRKRCIMSEILVTYRQYPNELEKYEIRSALLFPCGFCAVFF
jgi:hypothetical protein